MRNSARLFFIYGYMRTNHSFKSSIKNFSKCRGINNITHNKHTRNKYTYLHWNVLLLYITSETLLLQKENYLNSFTLATLCANRNYLLLMSNTNTPLTVLQQNLMNTHSSTAGTINSEPILLKVLPRLITRSEIVIISYWQMCVHELTLFIYFCHAL